MTTTPPVPPQPPEPEELAGRYQIVSKLGAGAFGTVHKAKDKILGRMIAVKTIRFDGLAASGEGRNELMARFRREAQVSAQLRHPNVVTIYDVGEDAGVSYIAMEFIDGVGLDKVIQGHGALPVERAASIAAQVADALDYAHRHGVVHRDIKPANIMIEDGDRVKVADFGIAKSMNSGENLTMTGGLLGTPSYMSPEQARGGEIDGRTDLFALGCILYEMLAGHKAFRGDSVTALIFKILSEHPEPLSKVGPHLPPAIIAAAEKAIDKDPAKRYQTGREFADDLKRLTQPGVTPTLRQRELPTAPVRSLAGTATSPAYTPATIISPEAQALSAAAPTVLGAAPTVVSSPPPLPRSDAPPQPVPVRRGGGAMLVAGLGLAALLVLAVIGAVAWKFMSGRGASTTTTAEASPVPDAVPSTAQAAPAAHPTAAASEAPAPPSAAPGVANEPAAATQLQQPPVPAAAPSRAPVSATRPAPPAANVNDPAPAQARAHTAEPEPDGGDDFTELDRQPGDLVDGSEAGRRAAEAYRSGSSGTYRTPLRARNPIPQGLLAPEARVAVNLYNLAMLQEEFRRREGHYAALPELLASRRLGRWMPRGYRLDARIGEEEFEITAEPQSPGLRALSVDETRLVRLR